LRIAKFSTDRFCHRSIIHVAEAETMTTTTDDHALPTQVEKPRSGLLSAVPLFFGILSIALAIVAQYRLNEGYTQESLLLFGAALILTAVAFFRQANFTPMVAPTPAMHINLFSGLGIALAVGAVTLGGLALPQFRADPPPLSAWWLHLGSLALFMLAVVILDRFLFTGERVTVTEEKRPISPLEIFALVAIVGIALFLRLYRLDAFPFGTWYDEAENGLQALRILEQPDFWPLFVGSIHAPAHYLYLIATSFTLFGATTTAIRIVSVVMGVGAVLAGYLVGRELFGRRIMGLTVAFLLAVAGWSINFSRIGMYNIATPLFELLAIGFLLRGMRRQRLTDYLWAGLSLGLGFSFYSAFQLFLPVVGIFILYALVTVRGFLRNSWSGLIVMGMAALLVVAPILLFAYEKPDIYFSRTQNTFLFADKSPDERWPALVESVRKHALMFNLRGDPNGRHNLPGEPMLDPVLGGLMVLGLGLTVLRFYRPGALLLLLWMGVMLLGGILSLDFEAPQSLRAIGTLPAAYLLAALPIYALWRAWKETGAGRRYPRLFVWPLLAGLIYIGYINYHDYFVRRAQDFASWNAFSTPESIAANLLVEEGDEADFYIISFFHGHPSINFLARDRKNYGRLETTDQMPLRRSPDRDTVLILNAESRSLYDEARRHYPNATFEEIRAPFGGPPVIFYARLTPEDLASIQGLTGHYYANEDWEGDPDMVRKDSMIQFDWTAEPPLPAPFSAEWTGVLNIERYGPYRLILRTPAAAELYLNEEKLLEGSGELSSDIVLASGNHALRLRAVGGDGIIQLAWQAPGAPEETIPTRALYVPPVSNNGLMGRFYPNGNWQPPEAFARIDPKLEFYFHVPLLPRPYTVEWLGKIYIAQAGLYRFGLESIDESILYINDQEIVAAYEPNQLREGSITLSEGLHDVRIRYADRTAHTHINFYWSPPGRGQSHVPAEVLFPPQSSYDRIDLEAAAQIFRVQADTGAASVASSAIAATRLTPPTDVVTVPLNQPRVLAAAPAGGRIYAADATQMLILDPSGRVERRIERGGDAFGEISDIAVAASGEVYVLDAGRARLSLFTADGVYQRDIPIQDMYTGRSRGIFIDDQDRIWIANTPNGQIVATDQDGNVLQVLPVLPGTETQPVDVLVTADGAIYVTDVASSQLVRIRPELGVRDGWSIPVANSVDGPHLAQDSAGNIYMSVPEQGAVLRIEANTADGIEYALPRQRETPPKVVGIGVDGAGRVWVIDSDGSAVISFAPEE
jgi:streptogramin lyase/4-amino-4-deoxy-L-arabinose transferase-like glycosyltransferase